MTDTANGHDWERAGRYITRRFRHDLGKSAQATANEAGVSVSTLNNMRNGRPVEPATRRKVEKALHWPEGEIERLATDPDHEPPDDRVVTDLERLARVEAEAAELKVRLASIEEMLETFVRQQRRR